MRVTAHQQHLQLMGLQLMDCAISRPIGKAAPRETLMADPKTLTIIGQDFDRRAPAIAEDDEPATEGINLELRPADPGHAIDAGAKIDTRYGDEYPHLPGKLDHKAPQPDRHNCNTTSVAALGAISICSLCPLGPCSDSRHPLGLTGSAPVNAMNFTAFWPACLLP